MSELQLDDPDPLSRTRDYFENYETGLTYEGYELSGDLLRQEIESRDEREAIRSLSNYAALVLEQRGEGEPTRCRVITEQAELIRIIHNGGWIYTFKDNAGDVPRCRSWLLGGEGISWCDNEWRYEEASSVQARMEVLMPLQTIEVPEPRRLSATPARIKRALAASILRERS